MTASFSTSNKLKYYTLLLPLFVLSCDNLINQLNDFEIYQKTIYNHFPKIETADKDNYINECLNEERKKILFPPAKPEYAIVYSDNLLTVSKKLDNASLGKILLILNDSSSFIWGEIGTPYFDRHIQFLISRIHVLA